MTAEMGGARSDFRRPRDPSTTEATLRRAAGYPRLPAGPFSAVGSQPGKVVFRVMVSASFALPPAKK
jgi:hypothetical protein